MRYVTGWREVVTTARVHTGRRSGGDAASGRELSAHNERVCVCVRWCWCWCRVGCDVVEDAISAVSITTIQTDRLLYDQDE